jgi:hypothetical protein
MTTNALRPKRIAVVDRGVFHFNLTAYGQVYAATIVASSLW